MNEATAAPLEIAIRSARTNDLPILREIEVEAGRAFGDIGMDEVASDDPFAIDELAGYQRAGRAWVAVDSGDRPIGYVVVDLVAGNAHIEQVSVRPTFGRRGVGRALIEHVAIWARDRRLPAMTLTTFRDVAWNAPYYERCGFRSLRSDEVTPQLAAIRRREGDHGLDRWPRVCMRREINVIDVTDETR